MSIETKEQWGEVERRAQVHEVNEMSGEVGLPFVTITTEDRLRGAIVEAIGQIEAGHIGLAYKTLKEAMKL